MGFTKKIKVPIDGSPTKSQKTMGSLIFLVNSAALHQKHLCILNQISGDFWGKLNFVQILPIWTFCKSLTGLVYQISDDFWGKLNFVRILPIWTF